MEDPRDERRLNTLESEVQELQQQLSDALAAIVDDLEPGRTDPRHKECMHRLKDVANRAKAMLKPDAIPQRKGR